MPRALNKLSDATIRSGKLKEGLNSDGGGLYLRKDTSKRDASNVNLRWVIIYTRNEKRVELGAGSYGDVSLAQARERAREVRTQLALGQDPLRMKHTKIRPFAAVFEEFITVNEPSWVPRVTRRYRSFLSLHLTLIAQFRIDHVDKDDIQKVLAPIWHTPSGRYLRSALERCIDFAVAKEYRLDGPNPARMKGNLALTMPKAIIRPKHHAALSWKQMPDLFAKLRANDTQGARAMMFAILCALRQFECRAIRFEWIEGDVLHLPAEVTKTRRAFDVPLSKQALAMIEKQRIRTGGNGYLFPGRFDGHLAHAAMPNALRAAGYPNVTAHGCARASFVTWAVEYGNFPDTMADRCLNHLVGSRVARAYQHSDFIAQRREIHNGWSNYLVASQ